MKVSASLFTVFLIACNSGGGASEANTPGEAKTKITLPDLTWSESLPDIPAIQPQIYAGETHRWEISLKGINLAEFQLQVASTEDDPVLRGHIKTSRAASLISKVHDTLVSTVDPSTGAMRFFRYDIKFGDWAGFYETRRTDEAFTVRETVKGRDLTQTQQLPDNAFPHDMASFIYFLRSWQPNAGDKAQAYIMRQGYFWLNQMHVRGVETIQTKRGPVQAMRIDGISRRVERDLGFDDSEGNRLYTIWVEQGGTKLPVKIVAKTYYGDIVSELTPI